MPNQHTGRIGHERTKLTPPDEEPKLFRTNPTPPDRSDRLLPPHSSSVVGASYGPSITDTPFNSVHSQIVPLLATPFAGNAGRIVHSMDT